MSSKSSSGGGGSSSSSSSNSNSNSNSGIPLTVKWGKESYDFVWHPSTGVKGLQVELEERTGVPRDRMKILAKSKGLWKGVLKETENVTGLDWSKAAASAAGSGSHGGRIQLLLMGSAANLGQPRSQTVFLEDLPPEEVAKVQEPSGLVNLGNTCYLNSVVQCLRAIEPLRRGLAQYNPSSPLSYHAHNDTGTTLFLAALKDTLYRLDRQATPVEPDMLVQTTRLAFPQFAHRGPHGQPMQQDAEEFYSGLLTLLASELTGPTHVQAGLPGVTHQELVGADNLVDALFGMKLQEILTCDEVDDTTAAEPPVVSYDLHRKLVCNIQGGSDTSAQVNVSDIRAGLALSLNGKIEKQSAVLGRNAMWTRQQRLARLPPVVVVQFGRFFWKETPDSRDHAGVKCKVMKPVAFDTILDVYDLCSDDVRAVLKVSRDKAAKEEEDRVNRKLLGQDDHEKKNDTATAMEVDGGAKAAAGDLVNNDDDNDDDLQAALAMSMEPDLPPVGPGLPKDFQGLYELFAVVTHKGRDADGGHYMAWVKARENSSNVLPKIADTNQDNEDWFVFDDDEVSPCKTEDVLKLKGGGDWHISYLNFYRAKK